MSEPQPPWAAAYGPGVPLHLDYDDSTLRRPARPVRAAPPRPGRPGLPRRHHHLRGLRRPGRPGGGGSAPARRRPRRQRGPGDAELPAERRRLLRGAPARCHRGRAQPALHRGRAAPTVRRPRGHGRDRVGQGRAGRRAGASRARRWSTSSPSTSPPSCPGRSGSPCGCRSRRPGRPRPAHGPGARHVAWSDLLTAPPLARPTPAPSVDDLAPIQYTTGTTGVPKGVPLSHRNLVANAAQGRAWVPGLAGAGDRSAALPMFHAYGLTLGHALAMSSRPRLVLFPSSRSTCCMAATRGTRRRSCRPSHRSTSARHRGRAPRVST